MKESEIALELKRELPMLLAVLEDKTRLPDWSAELGENWIDSLPEAVERVREYRRQTMSSPESDLQAKGAQRGRLLVLFTDLNLMDGAAFAASAGFFDDLNFPKPETWVSLCTLGVESHEGLSSALLCWVPAHLVEQAQAGIDANPEECLGWLSDVSPSTHRLISESCEQGCRFELIDAG